MSEKNYRITTKSKTFELDCLRADNLKEDNNTFYARETKADTWNELTVLEKRTTVLKWCGEHDNIFVIPSVFIWLASLIVVPFLIIKLFNLKNTEDLFSVLFAAWFFGSCFVIGVIIAIIEKALQKIPSFYVTKSDKQIREIIEKNKPHSYSYSYTSHSGGKTNHNYNSSGSGRSNYGGGYSGGSTDRHTNTNSTKSNVPYLSSEMLDKSLKELNDKGLTWDVLANDKTEAEKEKIFADQLGNAELGHLANEKFNRDSVWPARKSTLKKLINNGEYENDGDKETLTEQLNNIGTEITQDEFQDFARNIKQFHEKKKRIDNHVKYEGRLSNKDIKAIKEYHGYVCMACGLDPVKEYGEKMKGILEAHHKNPYSEIDDGETRTVEPNDFLILCPNCHRLIHKLNSPDDLGGLKKLVNKSTSLWWME